VVKWRSTIRWPVAIPYVFLYLATIMFYWWPLGQFGRPLWFAYAIIFRCGHLAEYQFAQSAGGAAGIGIAPRASKPILTHIVRMED
jgi:hypothetical protein